MPWGAAVGAGIGLIGNAMQDKGGKGGGSQTASKEPWAAATPWLLNNLVRGQTMQDQYLAQPISAKQQQATDNQYALSDYMRGQIPSLLSQLQAQPLGYDRNNPTAKAKAFDWSLLGGGGANALNQRSVGAAQDVAPVVKQAPAGEFTNQSDILTGMNMSGLSGATGMGESALLGGGGYGSFKYGMQPKPGTQAYRDMSEYFANGGEDPNNLYGRKKQGYGDFGGSFLLGGGPGVSVGDGVGVAGSAAAVGSAANF